MTTASLPLEQPAGSSHAPTAQTGYATRAETPNYLDAKHNPKAMLANSTALTPAQYESRKTRQQKAEDVIYTLNHAVTCLSITDLFVLGFIGNTVKYFSKDKKPPGWVHDHGDEYSPMKWIRQHITGSYKNEPHAGHDHPPGEHIDHVHPEPHPEHNHGPSINAHSNLREVAAKAWHNAKGWVVGEAIGDLGAVPVTMFAQRFFPGFMDGIRHHLEPVIGHTFRKNTQHAAIEWGAKKHLAADSKEVTDRAEELYEYEMRHMPQMAVWTVASVALNFGVMLGLHKWKPDEFEHVTPKNFMIGKGMGAAITAGLVLGLRGFSPNGAHKWDQTIGKHVVAPITKGLGRLIGIKSSDVDDFQQKRDMLENTKSPIHVHVDAPSASETFKEAAIEGKKQELPKPQVNAPVKDMARLADTPALDLAS